MCVEGIYSKRLALSVLPYIWLQPHLHPSATQRQNGHDPTIFLSLSTLSVGGKGLPAQLARRRGVGQEKTTAKKRVDLFQYILSTLLRVRTNMSKLLTLIRMTKDEKVLAIFKGLML
jgi:hypothetical protein